MEKFVVRVDLSTFFEDERKHVLILANPNEMTSVEMLQKKVEQIFNVESVQFLSDGFFIPPQEDIDVVRKLDLVRAFIPKKKNKKSEQQTSKERESLQEDEKQKKRKHQSVENGLSSSTPRNAKKSKGNAPIPIEEQLPKCRSYEISSTNEVEARKSVKEQTEPISMEIQENVTKPKKSHPKKRSRIPSSTLLNASYEAQSPKNVSQNLSKSHIFFNQSGEAVNTSKATQVEDSNETEKSFKKAAPKIIFRCNLFEGENRKPRDFALKPTVPHKTSIQIQEHIVLLAKTSTDSKSSIASRENKSSVSHKFECKDISTSTVMVNDTESLKESEVNESLKDAEIANGNEIIHAKEISFHHNNALNDSSIIMIDEECDDDDNDSFSEEESDEVINLNETANETKHDESKLTLVDNNVTANENSLNNSEKHINKKVSIEEMLLFSKPLKNLPNVDDIIIFKVCCSKDKIGSIFSKYISGKVVYTNKRTKGIKMIVMDGDISLLPTKYFANLDYSGTDQLINIKLDDMFEPRIFFLI